MFSYKLMIKWHFFCILCKFFILIRVFNHHQFQVLSRLVSSAVSRIEVCRQAKEKEKENLAGSDCGSLESEDSLSESLVKVEEKELDVIGCGSSDDGSTL